MKKIRSKKTGTYVNRNLLLITFCIIIIIGLVTNLFYVNNLNRKILNGYKDRIKELEMTIEILNNQADTNVNIVKTSKSKKQRVKIIKANIQSYITHTNPKISLNTAEKIADSIVTNSKKYNVPPELVVGIIEVESTFNPKATGPKTPYGRARGLMQVMPMWAKEFKLKSKYQLHEIDTSIKTGIKVFKIHLEEADGDISKGLYYYVNRSERYINKVYAAAGRFTVYTNN